MINNIQTVQQQQQPVQQYTITLDGKTFKSNQIHYKIEPTGTITIQEPFVQQITSTPPATPTQQIRYNRISVIKLAIDLIELFLIYSNSTLSQVNEFLKLKPANKTPGMDFFFLPNVLCSKLIFISHTEPQIVLKRKEPTIKLLETSPNKKPKINLVLASTPAQTPNQQVETVSVLLLYFYIWIAWT